jgi:hypothetical protein
VGDLKIFKINLKTFHINTFGKKFPHYIKPYTSKKMKESFSSFGAKTILKERHKMSFVRDLFATDKYVILVYTARNRKHEDLGYRMQFYSLNGTFLKELSFPNKPGTRLFLNKKDFILYAIKWNADEELDESYSIQKYKLKGQ